MKGNKKILVIAILLLLIAVSYGTYAIYKSSVSGDATVTAAKWAIEFSDGGSNTYTSTMDLEFTAADCVNNSHVADGKIAPGASCTKYVTIDATGTEVDVEYELEITGNVQVNGSNKPANSNDITASVGTSDGEILMSDAETQAGQTDRVPITITWAGQEGAAYDAGDTEIGEGGWEITVPVTLTAKQMIGS